MQGRFITPKLFLGKYNPFLVETPTLRCRLSCQEELQEFINENNRCYCQISFPRLIRKEEDSYTEFSCAHDGLFIRQKEYFVKILFADIRWIEASRGYSYIHTVSRGKLLATYPLSKLQKKLPSCMFIRPHRSFLLNINYVDKYIGNMLCIENQSFIMSKKHKDEILKEFLFLDDLKKGNKKKKPGSVL